MTCTLTENDRIQKMIERRRDFHRYPETGCTEFRTTAKVAEIMDRLGYTLRFGGDFMRPETSWDG